MHNRSALLVVVLVTAMAQVALAKPRRGWFCYLGWNEAGQGVQACERDKSACEHDLSNQTLAQPAHCFPARQAAAITIKHKDGKKETLAVPQLEACQFIREALTGEEGAIITADCKMVP